MPNKVKIEIVVEGGNAKEAVRTLREELGSLSEKSNRASAGVSTLSGALSSFAGNLAANAVSALTSALSQLPAVIAQVAKAGGEFNSMSAALTQVSGSAQIAGDKIRELGELSERTAGLTFRDALTGQKNLELLGFSAKRATNLLEGLAKARVISGSTQDDVKAVIINLTQLAAQGKITGDEIKETVIRIPVLANVIKRELGTLSLADTPIEKFFTGLEAGLEKLPTLTGTASIATEKLFNSVDRLQMGIGAIIDRNPELIALIQLTTDRMNGLTNSFVDAESANTKQTETVISNLSRSIIWFKNYGHAVWLVSSAVTKAVVGVAVAAVSGFYSLAEDIVNAVKYVGTNAGNAIIDTVNKAVNAAKTVSALLPNGLGGAIQSIPEIPRFPEPQYLDSAASFRNYAASFFDELGRLNQSLTLLVKQQQQDFNDFERYRRKTVEDQKRLFTGTGSPLFNDLPKSNPLNIGDGGKGKGKKAPFALSPQGKALVEAANRLGVSPLDLAAIIGFETAATFSPSKRGGAGGNYQGLIQFGPAERKQFGVSGNQTFEQQLLNSVVPYFKARFEKAGRATEGASLLDLYTTVIAGNPNANKDAKDAFGTSARSGTARIMREFYPVALKRFFGGNESNVKNFSDDLSRQLSSASDQATLAKRREETAKATQFFQTFGFIPTAGLLKNITEFRNEGLKKQGAAQITEQDVVTAYKQNQDRRIQPIPTTDAENIGTNINRRETLDEQYLNGLRESLNIAEKRTALIFRQRNFEAEISEKFLASIIDQQLQLSDIEQERLVVVEQNADASFAATRRTLAATAELLDLERERTSLAAELANIDLNREYRAQVAILRQTVDLTRQRYDLEDQIRNFGVNAGEKIRIAELEKILEIRNRELEAVIQIKQAQIELSQQLEFSATQTYAKVLDYLARQKSLTEATADGIIKAYERVAGFFDKKIDNSIGKIPIIGDIFGEIAKNQSRGVLTKITTGLLDNIFPGLGSKIERDKNPLLAETKDQTKLLKSIDAKIGFGGITGGGGGNIASGNGGGLLGNLINIIRPRTVGTPPFNSNGFLPALQGGILPDLNPKFASGTRGTGFSSSVSGGGGLFGNLFGGIKNLFSNKPGGLFAPRENLLTGRTSGLGGVLGGIGSIASFAGGLIGGRAGSFISNIGSGLSIGASFGPVGAAIGAGVGILASLFGGSAKRRADKNENLPALQNGFTDALAKLRELLSGVKSLRIEPDSALSQADELRSSIASGFGITFQSKKYKTQAAQQITARLAEADAIIEDLKKAAAIASAAGERRNRIVAEFASGGLADIALNFNRRFNGKLAGNFDARDDIPAMLSKGEVVLNPAQVSRLGGSKAMRRAGVPGFATGGATSPPTKSNAFRETNFTLVLNGVAISDAVSGYLETETGETKIVKVVANAQKNKRL
jgi:tape measure domain-containing protein